MKQFYIYIHSKPNGTPFYVGKGCGGRAYRFNKRSPHHRNVIRKYGKENIIISVFPCESEEHAFQEEIKMIVRLRKMGYILCNATDGGEGSSGYHHTDEVIRKSKEQGKWTAANGLGVHAQTPEQRREIGEQAVKNKTGIHAMTKEQRRELGKRAFIKGLGVHAMTKEQRRELGRMVVERGLGIHTPITEARRETCRKNGKASTKVMNSQRWQCRQCDVVTNPGNLGFHQKRTGHEGRTRLI